MIPELTAKRGQNFYLLQELIGVLWVVVEHFKNLWLVTENDAHHFADSVPQSSHSSGEGGGGGGGECCSRHNTRQTFGT